MKTNRLLPVLLLLAAAAFAADESRLTIDVPASVQATIAKEKADGKVTGFQTLNEADGATYRITLELDGRPYTLLLDAAGRVLRKDLDQPEAEPKPLVLHDLPEAVKKTIYRETQGASVKEVELREEKKVYTTSITLAGRRYLIEVGADGKLLSKHFEEENEDED